ncbi:hypothetical protein WME75_31800 [Sorangium sp. So ce1014]|uniref:hypothetical protein n=1 Tax=Sorangium sp. So ce1014 TaxID=3133326 RepID=UPI003F5DA8BE
MKNDCCALVKLNPCIVREGLPGGARRKAAGAPIQSRRGACRSRTRGNCDPRRALTDLLPLVLVLSFPTAFVVIKRLQKSLGAAFALMALDDTVEAFVLLVLPWA